MLSVSVPRSRLRRLALLALCVASAGCSEECDRKSLLYQIQSPDERIVAGQTAEFGVLVFQRTYANTVAHLAIDPGTLPPVATYSFRPPSGDFAGTSAIVVVQTRVDTPAGRYEFPIFVNEIGLPTRGIETRMAILEITARPEPPAPGAPPLSLSCRRAPASGPPPLTVSFLAEPTGCVGACRFSWYFDDGQSEDVFAADHTYRTPGVYQAIGTLSDSRPMAVTCRQRVEVLTSAAPTTPGGDPRPSPTPSPRASPPSRPGARARP